VCLKSAVGVLLGCCWGHNLGIHAYVCCTIDLRQLSRHTLLHVSNTVLVQVRVSCQG
jgi:hypothetical protein